MTGPLFYYVIVREGEILHVHAAVDLNNLTCDIR